MAALVQLVFILLTNAIVSGQAIVGEEYTVRGVLYGKADNSIEIKADYDSANLQELLNTTDGSSLNGWYLESSEGVTLLTYWRTLEQYGNTYWWYYTEPDIYDTVTHIAHTMHFRATFTSNPTSAPTTAQPTEETSAPTTATPTSDTIAPTAVPSAAPTVLVYLYEEYQLPSLGNAIGIYDQYAIMGDQSYGKLANDAGSAGPGIAYIFDLNTTNNTYISLIPSDTSYADAFGLAVSIYGDYAAVSAPYHDYGTFPTIYGYGTVYIYKRSSGNQWQEMTNFEPATDPGYTHFYFGQRIMMKGDYILVGAHMGNKAYIFKREGVTWTEMDILIPDASIYCCGWGDALNEMHLCNNAEYVLISYTFDSNTANFEGKVFVFKRTDESWSQIDTLTSPSSDASDYQFGRATAFYDDYIAITEHGNDAVYIYTIDKENNDTITLIQVLSVSPAYGAPLALHDDILSVSLYDTNEVWVYQKNVNGQFEKINTLLSSDGGTIGSKIILQANNLITSGAYVYDIAATNHPTSDPTTAAPTAITMTPSDAPSAAPTEDTFAPTAIPSATPTTDAPSASPSQYPSYSPTEDTVDPTSTPSITPSTGTPSASPSQHPSDSPTEPTVSPTEASISCNESVAYFFGSGDITTRYVRFVLSKSYDVTFSNCMTPFDTKMSVYNEDKSVTVSYVYCDGDDCGSSGSLLCETYNSNEAFTIPMMDAATYYIGIRPYSSSSYPRDYIMETLCVPASTQAPTTPYPTQAPSTPYPTQAPVTSTTRATDGEISCNQEMRYNDTQYFQRYYRFVLETTSDVTFSNCDTAYDTRLNVYNHLMSSVSSVYCDGDDCECSPNERFSIESMSDGLYYVETEPYSSSTAIVGPYVLEINCSYSSSAPTTAAPTGAPSTAYPTQPSAAPITRAPTEPSAPPTKRPTSTPTTGTPTTEATAVGNGALFACGNAPWIIFVVTIFVILMH